MSDKQQNQRQPKQSEPASPWTLVYQSSSHSTDAAPVSPWDITQEPTHTALTAIYDHTQRTQDN